MFGQRILSDLHLWRMRFGVTSPRDRACPEVYGMYARICSNLLESEEKTTQMMQTRPKKKEMRRS
jgi:hypothetical protein